MEVRVELTCVTTRNAMVERYKCIGVVCFVFVFTRIKKKDVFKGNATQTHIKKKIKVDERGHFSKVDESGHFSNPHLAWRVVYSILLCGPYYSYSHKCDRNSPI